MYELSTEILVPRKISIRYKRSVFDSMKYINQAEDAESILRVFSQKKQLDYKEFFWVITLSRANRVIGISTLAKGSGTGVIVCAKEVVQLALLSNACGVILAHNHPSGKLDFSNPDISLTGRLKKCLKLFEIELLDHILLTSESHISMAEERLLP